MERVPFRSDLKVFGDIETPTVVIDEGGIFEGMCSMKRAKQADERKLAVIASGGPAADSPEPLGTIHGTITSREDEKTAEPIRGAKVSARCKSSGEKATSTDDLGFYELSDLGDGRWKLKVEAKGYEAAKATIEISGGGAYKQDFEYP